MHFLAKNGRISGPFTAEQLESLRRSGEIERYTWTWDSAKKDWIALDPAPSHGPESMSASSPPQATRRASNRSTSLRNDRAPKLEILLHDFREVHDARIRTLNEQGCELLIARPSGHGAAVPFGERASVLLNLLDPTNDESMDIGGSVTAIQQCPEGILYRIHWGETPVLLQA